MKRTPCIIAALIQLVAACAALADPPALSVPASIAGLPGAFLTVPATTTGKNVAWVSLDAGLNLFPVSLLKDSHTAIVCASKPGSYRLLAVTAAGDEISAPVICNIVIQSPEPPPVPPQPPGPGPAPTPPVPPPPGPAPSPSGKVAWAVVVIDNNARTPAQGRLITSATLIQSLRQRGVTLRVLDVSDPQVKSLNYGPAVAAAGGAPALLEFTDTGQRIKAIPLPADEASFLATMPPLPATMYCPSGLCPLVPSVPNLQVKP